MAAVFYLYVLGAWQNVLSCRPNKSQSYFRIKTKGQ